MNRAATPALALLAAALITGGLFVRPLVAQDDPAAPQPAPAQPADADKAPGLIEKLKSGDYREREQATAELEAMGRSALPALEQALKNSPDPDLQWRLEDLLKKAQRATPPQAEATPRTPRLPGGLRVNPGGGGFSVMMATSDADGSYTKQTLGDGKIRASRTPRGGQTETREFDSEEQFREQWPEVAGKFGNFTLRLSPGNRQPAVPPVAPGPDSERTEPAQPAEPQMPGPFPLPLPDGNGEMGEMQEQLRKLFEQMFGPDSDPFKQLREQMEQAERQFEQLQREMEERQRKLQELGERRPDPTQDPEGFAKWLAEYMKALRGNGEALPLPLPGQPGQPGQPGTPRPQQPQKPNQQQEDEDFFFSREQPRERELIDANPPASAGGATFGAISDAIRAQLQLARGGLIVTGVADNGLLTRAGLQRFDVLLAVNGKPINTADDVQAALLAVPADSEFVMQIIRRKERLQLLGNK